MDTWTFFPPTNCTLKIGISNTSSKDYDVLALKVGRILYLALKQITLPYLALEILNFLI